MRLYQKYNQKNYYIYSFKYDYAVLIIYSLLNTFI